MKVFNFSSGPTILPKSIVNKIQKELKDWKKLGISVMEINHRSKEFLKIIRSSERNLRNLLSIPDYYQVLFCQGGARAQFSAVPMNLLRQNRKYLVDYIESGYWSREATREAKKYCITHIIDITREKSGIKSIQPMSQWELSDKGKYVHYCPNETVDGIAIKETPNFGNRIIVADFSSSILSYPLEIERFGIIYASAQKNIGSPGLTLVIIREDLLNLTNNVIPSVLNYKTISENRSLLNTPPTFSWYISYLILKWIKKMGGLKEMEKMNQKKSSLLYNFIDQNDFYINRIAPKNRSRMNVPFRLSEKKLEPLFIRESLRAGLYSLKGHRSVGGMRASIYNAMPIEGVKRLIRFMKNFVQKYG